MASYQLCTNLYPFTYEQQRARYHEESLDNKPIAHAVSFR